MLQYTKKIALKQKNIFLPACLTMKWRRVVKATKVRLLKVHGGIRVMTGRHIDLCTKAKVFGNLIVESQHHAFRVLTDSMGVHHRHILHVEVVALNPGGTVNAEPWIDLIGTKGIDCRRKQVAVGLH